MKKLILVLALLLSACSVNPLPIGQKYVVMLTYVESVGRSGGTGFHVINPFNNKVIILTNRHVCDKRAELDAMDDEQRHKRLKVLKISDKTDLCAVEPMLSQQEGEEPHGIPVAKRWHRREHVAVMGHPVLEPLTIRLGEILLQKKIQMLDHGVSKEQCKKEGHEYVESFFNQGCVVEPLAIATDVEGYGGNSGSPMINDHGFLVGVIFAGNNSNNKLYAVPLNEVRDFLQSLIF